MSQFDRIVVAGAPIGLGGVLRISLINNYVPQPPVDPFVFMIAGSFENNFTQTMLPTVQGLVFKTQFGAGGDTLSLVVTNAP